MFEVVTVDSIIVTKLKKYKNSKYAYKIYSIRNDLFLFFLLNEIFYHFLWQKYFLFKVLMSKCRKRLLSTTISIRDTFFIPVHREYVFWKIVL